MLPNELATAEDSPLCRYNLLYNAHMLFVWFDQNGKIRKQPNSQNFPSDQFRLNFKGIGQTELVIQAGILSIIFHQSAAYDTAFWLIRVWNYMVKTGMWSITYNCKFRSYPSYKSKATSVGVSYWSNELLTIDCSYFKRLKIKQSIIYQKYNFYWLYRDNGCRHYPGAIF